MAEVELPRGVAVLSIDTELAWGEAHRRSRRRRRRTTAPRTGRSIEESSTGLTRHEIPATWALVGHLLLDNAPPTTAPAPRGCCGRATPGSAGRLVRRRPVLDPRRRADVYRRDLVTAFAAARSTQEMGRCHSYAHLIADEPGCGRGGVRLGPRRLPRGGHAEDSSSSGCVRVPRTRSITWTGWVSMGSAASTAGRRQRR